MFRNILGKSFIFARNDEVWKQKRKATSHTFYKDRMEHMLEVLKDKLEETFTSWSAKIEESETKSFDINMATVF